MDARITKQRLGNMLSYDWLKIVGVIALAALFFSVFFVMIATRATSGQSFYVYAYNGLQGGTDFGLLNETLLNRDVFSYEILNTGSEVFSKSGLYGDSVFSARRSSGEGRVMFVNDHREEKDGKETSQLISLITGLLEDEGTDNEKSDLFLEPEKFMADAKKYLERYFGQELKEKEPDAAETYKTFMERNKKDKRFRTDAKKEAGVQSETRRLKKLKSDYETVENAILDAKLTYVTCSSEKKTYQVGFSMRALNLVPLVYYTVDEDGKTVSRSDDIVLGIFDNGAREGDLKYETLSFLSYLLKTYGTQA